MFSSNWVAGRNLEEVEEEVMDAGTEDGAGMETSHEDPPVCPEERMEGCLVDVLAEGRVTYTRGPKITYGGTAVGTTMSLLNGQGTDLANVPGAATGRFPKPIPQVCPEDDGWEEVSQSALGKMPAKVPHGDPMTPVERDREAFAGAESEEMHWVAGAKDRPPSPPTPPESVDPGTKLCGNCQHPVAISNLALHETHCFKNLLVCSRCGERVRRTDMDEHFESEHVEVKCKCGKTLEKCKLSNHKTEECPLQTVACRYCELEQPRATMEEHEGFCGARTELCAACLVYVQKQDEAVHRQTCPGTPAAQPRANASAAAAAAATTAATAAVTAAMASLRALGEQGFPDMFDDGIAQEYREWLKYLDSDDGDSDGELKSPSLAENLRTMMSSLPTPADDLTSLVAREPGEPPENDQELLPCEFCSKLVPARDLVLHQSGCNPDVSHARLHYVNGVPRSIHTPQLPAQPPTEQLPCQYCYESVSAPLLQAHQERCLNEQKNAFANIRGQLPAATVDDEEPELLDNQGMGPSLEDEVVRRLEPSDSRQDTAETDTSVSPEDAEEMEASASHED